MPMPPPVVATLAVIISGNRAICGRISSAICHTVLSRSSTSFKRIIMFMMLDPVVLKSENILPSSSDPEDEAMMITSG